MSYRVQVFVGAFDLNFDKFKDLITSIYKSENVELLFNFIPYDPSYDKGGVYGCFVEERSSLIQLIEPKDFESDDEIHFELFNFYISLSGIDNFNPGNRTVICHREGHGLFNKLKEIGKYELLLLYDMQKIADRFSPPKNLTDLSPN